MAIGKQEASTSNRIAVVKRLWDRLKVHPLARLGPGLITGVADDDPSGIATYSQAGAQFGLNMLWTMPLAFPLMAAIQSMCARIGRVTGKGLAANIKAAFPPIVLQGRRRCCCLIANTLNIAADVAADGRSRRTRHRLRPPPDDGVLRLRIARAAGLRSLPPLRLLPEVADALAARLCRGAVHRACSLERGRAAHGLAPVHARFGRRDRGCRRIRHDHQPLSLLLAGVRGSRGHAWRRAADPRSRLRPPRELRRIRWDTWSGMFYSDITAYFIILATAVTLNVAGDHRHRDGGSGGERAQAARRRLRLRSVRARHSRRRTDRRAGSRGLGCLRALRGHGLELGPRAQGDGRARRSTASSR